MAAASQLMGMPGMSPAVRQPCYALCHSLLQAGTLLMGAQTMLGPLQPAGHYSQDEQPHGLVACCQQNIKVLRCW